MAEKKPFEERSSKNKERKTPGFRTLGIRMSAEYASWLSEVAKVDRVTVAAFLDRAALDRAKAIGFAKAPPERNP